MNDLPLSVWIALAAALGLAAAPVLHRVIDHLPDRLAALWLREAREVLALEADDTDVPTPILRDPPTLLMASLIALLTAAASAVVMWKLGPTWQAAAGLALTWVLIVLTGIDLRTQLLPDLFTQPLLWLGLLLSLKPLFISAPMAILGAAFGYSCLWCVSWLSKLVTGMDGMGQGDLKLLAALGAWMGPLALLPIGLMSALLGTMVSGVLILLRRQERSQPMPYGPYLAIAGWIWLIAGDTLWRMLRSFSGMS
jgi:leader peptidase (prepilin peptidase)/N-methyltransferase